MWPLSVMKALTMGVSSATSLVAVLAHLLVGMAVRLVQQQRAVDLQRAGTFGVGLGRQQHLAHVRVHDDRIGLLVLGLGARQAAHLDAVLGISQRVLERHFRQAQRLVAHAQACGVHHHEHGLQALVRLPHQRADGAVDGDLGGGIAMDAHLVLQARAVDRVALPDRAVGVHLVLGHHEQADALAALRRIRQAGEHQVHDVLGEIMFAGADENLVAGDLVRALGRAGHRLGLGAQQAQVGAAVGLGQAHRAGPFAAGELGQVELLLLFGAVRMQRLVGAVRQPRVHGPGLVGAVEHLIEALVHDERQALAAVFRIARQCRPAAFHILRIGILEALGRGHFVRGLVQRAALLVTAHVERERHARGELAGFFQHGIHGVGIHLRMARDRLELLRDPENLVEDELHVAQGGV